MRLAMLTLAACLGLLAVGCSKSDKRQDKDDRSAEGKEETTAASSISTPAEPETAAFGYRPDDPPAASPAARGPVSGGDFSGKDLGIASGEKMGGKSGQITGTFDGQPVTVNGSTFALDVAKVPAGTAGAGGGGRNWAAADPNVNMPAGGLAAGQPGAAQPLIVDAAQPVVAMPLERAQEVHQRLVVTERKVEDLKSEVFRSRSKLALQGVPDLQKRQKTVERAEKRMLGEAEKKMETLTLKADKLEKRKEALAKPLMKQLAANRRGEGDAEGVEVLEIIMEESEEEDRYEASVDEDRDKVDEWDDSEATKDAYKPDDGDNGRFDAGKRTAGRGRLGQNAEEHTRPEQLMPRTCYIENTYLGGNAAYVEAMRRLDDAMSRLGQPHRMAVMSPQKFDAPPKAGIALSAALNTRWLEKTGRVYLQVGLQGSHRHGWRRPPLEVVLVVDEPVLTSSSKPATDLIRTLLRRLGNKDTLSVVTSGPTPKVIARMSRIRALRNELLPRLDEMTARPGGSSGALGAAMAQAGTLLGQAAESRNTLPGTQIVLVLTQGADAARVEHARSAAHSLNTRGIVTSVLEIGHAGTWWAVANAGHGNYHRVSVDAVADAVDAELESVSRVVARLLRLNVRLAPGVHAIRVLGSRVLDQQTVARVKAREEATDEHLSKSLGIESDRGDDDDGIQTVIPYFYGGDAHVVVFELWVEKPGKVADISLKYKDMVSLQNATAQTAATLRNVPREPTGVQLYVSANIGGFELGDTLHHAASLVEMGNGDAALTLLNQASAKAATDRALITRFVNLLNQGAWRHDAQQRGLLGAALRMAGRRKVGGTSA